MTVTNTKDLLTVEQTLVVVRHVVGAAHGQVDVMTQALQGRVSTLPLVSQVHTSADTRHVTDSKNVTLAAIGQFTITCAQAIGAQQGRWVSKVNRTHLEIVYTKLKNKDFHFDADHVNISTKTSTQD